MIETFKKIRGGTKLALFFLWTFFLLLIFFTFGSFSQQMKVLISQWWHRGCLKIFKIKVTLAGQISFYPKTLFVANHVSYLDIIAIGSRLKAAFVARAEVREIPLFGWLSTLQNTIFLQRDKSKNIQTHLKELIRRLNKPKSLVLFPEGISTDGADVLSFKSSLFAVTQFVKNLQVQPFSLLYKDKNGKFLSPTKRDYYAFYQGIPFGKHFWDMCCQSGIQIHLKFHSPIKNLASISRKDLATDCYKKIKQDVLNFLK